MTRATRWLSALVLVLACVARSAPAAAQPHPDSLALSVLRATPLIDGHNDLPWRMRDRGVGRANLDAYDLRARTRGQTDIERLRRGRVGGQLWSVYVPCGGTPAALASMLREQIALVRALVGRYPEALGLATGAADVERVFGDGRIASLIALEGAHPLGGTPAELRELHDLGVRAIGLTHNCTNALADAATDRPRHGGLSPLGVEMVRAMNRIGIVVDLAHASAAAMHDALDSARAPLVWTHTAARALVDQPRNVPDAVLRRLPANGGLVMITFVPAFLSPGGGATLADAADHVEHVRRVAGFDHVGIGGDFDGSPEAVRGLEDVSTYPALLAELARRGWTGDELARLAGGNFLRVLRRVEAVADALRRGEGGR